MTEYRAEPLADGSAWRVVDSDNRVVAWECQRDDARLFAASPDMLNLCHSIVTAVEYGFPIDRDGLHELAKSALAKAEGRDD